MNIYPGDQANLVSFHFTFVLVSDANGLFLKKEMATSTCKYCARHKSCGTYLCTDRIKELDRYDRCSKTRPPSAYGGVLRVLGFRRS